MKRILLVGPPKGKNYHTTYPPLGLLKLAAYHRKKGDKVRLITEMNSAKLRPDKIYITSLFTYAWEPVHEIIRYYSQKYKQSDIIVGGIYATLCKDHLKAAFGNKIRIHQGLYHKIENVLPDYSLIPEWRASILFSSRGCIRKCPFCAVSALEPNFRATRSIRRLIYPGHKKVIFWDNNFLASPYRENILDELEGLNLEVDFNQGIDARLISYRIAKRLRKLRVPLVRLAYDTMGIGVSLKRAIDTLKKVGFRGRRILVYCLYNYPSPKDTPETFLLRIKDIMEWGVVAYPMRYEPLDPRPKNTYISPHWSPEQLEMVADARRVIGYGGAFPPYEGLKKKILKAKNFEKAFVLRQP